MKSVGLIAVALLVAAASVQAGVKHKTEPTVTGYLIENKLTTADGHSAGTPGSLYVKQSSYRREWVVVSGEEATLQNGEAMEMVDDEGSVKIQLKMLNKQKKVQVNELPDGVEKNTDITPAKASTDSRLLQTSTWWLVNSINDLMSKFIVEKCRLGPQKQMKVVWKEEELDAIAAMSSIKDPEFPRLTVGRVPSALSGGAAHHSMADTHVLSHEYAHYFTFCTWGHHLGNAHNSDEAKAVNEAISDVATLAIRAQLQEDVQDPNEWLIGENLGIDVDGTQYLRKYYLNLDAAGRADTELDGRDKAMLENLSFDRYKERFAQDISKVKDYYGTGMIMATAWMKSIRNIYEVLRGASQKKKEKHYGRAGQVVLQGIFAALDSTFKETDGGTGYGDDQYFRENVILPIQQGEGDLGAESKRLGALQSPTKEENKRYDELVEEIYAAAATKKDRQYRWPGTWLHLRSCFIKKLKDVTEISSLSDADKKKVQRAAWEAFADHGMGPGAHIQWTIDNVSKDSYDAPNVSYSKSFVADTTVPAEVDVENGISCDMPVLTPDAHHNRDLELGEVSSPVHLRGRSNDDEDSGIELSSLPEME